MTQTPNFRPTVESRLLEFVLRQGLSTRAAISRVRSEGYRIGNDRARGLVNLATRRQITGVQRNALGIRRGVEVRGEGTGRTTRTIRATYRVIAPIIAHYQGKPGSIRDRPTIHTERTITIPITGIHGRTTLTTLFQRDFKNRQQALAREVMERDTDYSLESVVINVGNPRISQSRLELRRRAPGSSGFSTDVSGTQPVRQRLASDTGASFQATSGTRRNRDRRVSFPSEPLFVQRARQYVRDALGRFTRRSDA